MYTPDYHLDYDKEKRRHFYSFQCHQRDPLHQHSRAIHFLTNRIRGRGFVENILTKIIGKVKITSDLLFQYDENSQASNFLDRYFPDTIENLYI